MSAFNLEAGKRSLRIPAEVMALFPALHMRAPDTTELIGLSDAQWMSLLSFCDIAHLTLQMAQLPSEGFPQWVIDRLRTNLADNALRFERVKATYREAAAALDQAGVEHIVIKGFTQAPDYVANPQLRAQSDIDRIVAIWRQCLEQYGGPYLFGERSVADAMYAPVVTRFVTYDVKHDPDIVEYGQRILALPEMQQWTVDAQQEVDEIDELDVEF